MTEGSVLKSMTLFAIPLFIGTFFQQVYNMVDSMVVGKFVGDVQLGAVGACMGTFNLIIALLTGLTGGTGVLLAQQFGAKNHELLRKTFINSSILIVAVGIGLTIIGVFLAKPLVLLLGTPESQVPYANIYLTYMCAGIIANCLYNGMSAVLRALGDSITPLVVLISASVLNVILDLLFVIVFQMGVKGVAVATVLAQLVSAVACIIYVFVKTPELRFGWKDIQIEGGIIKEVVRIGVPAALSSCGVSISVMFMQRAINSCGDVVVTGYTVGNKAENIGMCLAYAIGMSVGTFCGQNIGAKKFDRVKKGMRIGCLIAIIYAVVMGALVFIFAEPFSRLFATNPEVIEVSKEVIYITISFAPVLGLIFVFQNFLRSAGDVAPTVWMSIMEIVARSVLAFIFVGIWGRMGIWWVTPIGWCASLLVGFLRYKSNRWKDKINLNQLEGIEDEQ